MTCEFPKKLLALVLALGLSCTVVGSSFVAMAAERRKILSKGSTLKFAVKVYPTYLSKGVKVTTTSSTKYTVSGITQTAGSKSTCITIRKK